MKNDPLMEYLAPFDKKLIEFILLNGYSLDRPGLICGKAGASLVLFEASRFFQDDSIEAYAFDFFQEALAWDVKEYTFDTGKAGIAWALLYLINNQFVEADYKELYGTEHQLIVDYLKEFEINQSNVENCVGYLMFLFAAREEISASDFRIIQQILVSAIGDYYSNIPSTPIERDSFYLNSLKLLGLYNENKQIRSCLCLTNIISLMIDTYKSISEECYVCTNFIFGLNLYIYGLNSGKNDVVLLAESTIDVMLINTAKETLSLKQIVDFLYVVEQLVLVGKNVDLLMGTYQQIASALIGDDMFEKGSIFYRMKKRTLFSLSEGILRLLLIRTGSVGKWASEKKTIMLF